MRVGDVDTMMSSESNGDNNDDDDSSNNLQKSRNVEIWIRDALDVSKVLSGNFIRDIGDDDPDHNNDDIATDYNNNDIAITVT